MMRQRVGLDHAILKSTFANMLSFRFVPFTVIVYLMSQLHSIE